MAISKKLEIIYYNGQPNGIRSIRCYLSTMTTYIIPREFLLESKKLKGINRHGIYYLINEDNENKISQIYVGQTRNGINRLEDHNRSKDFWNKAMIFLADKKTFSLDMISGLEAYAIKKATESNNFEVKNIANPNYEIDEYEKPFIETVYEEIKFIMSTQGYDLSNIKKNNPTNDNLFYTKKNGVVGIGSYDGKNFKVLKGSEIDINKIIISEKMNEERNKLLKEKTILEVNNKYELIKDVIFSSPSSAACFVLGGSQNGWTEWKNKDGNTLDSVYRNKK